MSHTSILDIVILAALLQAPATPQQPQQPQEPASVEGTVLRAGSTPPSAVSRARVVLNLNRGLNSITLTTVVDDSGHFAIRDIPPGAYNLMATRDGYVRATKAIVLTPRQSMTNIVLEMTPTSSISGRVRDRNGEPMGNVSVQAQRYSYREGRRILSPAQTALTNDLGEFRLYYLEPGRYVVTASPMNGPAPSGPSLFMNTAPGIPSIGGSSAESRFVQATASEFLAAGIVPAAMSSTAYVPIYFPGTTDPAATTPIDLAPGANFAAADFTVSEVRPHTIRGRIIDGVTGQPAGGATLILFTRDPNVDRPTRRNATTAADGTFELRSVAPGSYDILGMVGTNPQGMSSGGSGYPGGAGLNPIPAQPGSPALRDFAADPAGMRLAARIPVEVGGADIDNLTITAQRGFNLKGRVVLEGKSPEETQNMLNGIVVQLMPVDTSFEGAAMPAPVRPDGTFTAAGVIPGTFMIWLMRSSNLQNGVAYVKSATIAGIDVINPRLKIDGEPRGELEIVVGTDRGAVVATVVDAKGAPFQGARVVLVPDAPLRQHFDLYQSAVTNDMGTANLSGPAGDYTAYAFEKIDNGAWWDPEVMQKYAGQGTPVRLQVSGRPQLNLKLLR
jgi:hypothetical protein